VRVLNSPKNGDDYTITALYQEGLAQLLSLILITAEPQRVGEQVERTKFNW